MKILIVKTSSLGDIIHSFPVLNYLHGALSDVVIDWVAEKGCADLLHAHPQVSTVHEIDSHRWRTGWRAKEILEEVGSFRDRLRENDYDVLFDLQGNTKSAFVTMTARAKRKVGFGWKTAAEWSNVFATNRRYNPPSGKNIREDYLHLVQSYFKDKKMSFSSMPLLKIDDEGQKQVRSILCDEKLVDQRKVLVCPGSKWPNKRLSEASWGNLLQQLYEQKQCRFLFLWGTDEEKVLAERLQKRFSDLSVTIDRLPLPTLQHLMEAVDLVVAVDSLPLHLAGTTNTATFSIFGASSAQKYAPIGSQHHVVQGSCPYGKTFEKRCPILRTCTTGACMNLYTL